MAMERPTTSVLHQVDQFLNGKPPSREIEPVILASWERCRAAGVDPDLRAGRVVLGAVELQRRMEANRDLLDAARVVLDSINRSSGHQGIMLFLTDQDGIVLAMTGHKPTLRAATDINLIVGAKWTEDLVGTNAAGTALVSQQPVQTQAWDHYVEHFRSWNCSAAPILEGERRLRGSLCLTVQDRPATPALLSLTDFAAGYIRSRLDHQRARLKAVLLEKAMEQLGSRAIPPALVVDDHGDILTVTPAARDLLFAGTRPTADRLEAVFEPGLLAQLVHTQEQSRDAESRLETVLAGRGIDITVVGLAADGGSGMLLYLADREPARTAVRMSPPPPAAAPAERITFGSLVGRNEAFRNTLRLGATVARTAANVLLIGESGTGKELFARAIHFESPRAGGPFVALNCAAIAPNLIASELFGYVDGAFTGARHGGSPGKFEVAHGGTVFLDEIGDMPLDMQSWLLRVLEERKVVRVGGHTPIPVDIRIVAGTNCDLERAVASGSFRKDLYYRLCVVRIGLIPLRNRMDDVPLLAERFLGQLCARLGRAPVSLSPDALAVLARHDWPGNVRELRNALEHALYLTDGDTVYPWHLPDHLGTGVDPGPRDLAWAESGVIEQVLHTSAGSVTRAASRLGIARSTLYRKMRKYGLAAPRR